MAIPVLGVQPAITKVARIRKSAEFPLISIGASPDGCSHRLWSEQRRSFQLPLGVESSLPSPDLSPPLSAPSGTVVFSQSTPLHGEGLGSGPGAPRRSGSRKESGAAGCGRAGPRPCLSSFGMGTHPGRGRAEGGGMYSAYLVCAVCRPARQGMEPVGRPRTAHFRRLLSLRRKVRTHRAERQSLRRNANRRALHPTVLRAQARRSAASLYSSSPMGVEGFRMLALSP